MTVTKKKQRAYDEKNALSMYLEEINRTFLLSREEEEKYARDASKGNIAARNKLVNANLRFVINVAKKYQGQGLPLEDLISEGNMGLLYAIDRYDVDKGCRFITYAVWWIRQTITKAIYEKSRMIRLPLNKINELIQVQKARHYVQEGKSEIKEIARLLGMTPHYVEKLLTNSRDIVSLENPMYNENGSSTLGDCIEASKCFAPDTQAMDMALQDDIEQALDKLDDKEADVIRFRFGLGNKKCLSLKEIGEKLNLTKERIRQIEKKAIKHLRNPSALDALETYVA